MGHVVFAGESLVNSLYVGARHLSGDVTWCGHKAYLSLEQASLKLSLLLKDYLKKNKSLHIFSQFSEALL